MIAFAVVFIFSFFPIGFIFVVNISVTVAIIQIVFLVVVSITSRFVFFHCELAIITLCCIME